MEKKKIIYALGFFDGVHLGHQALLSACRELAAEHNCFAGVWTFTNHPNEFVSGQSPVLINTLKDRKRLLRYYHIDTIVSLPFDKTLMSCPWQNFLEDLLVNDAAGFVCGEDFRFGAGGCGTAKKLAAFCESKNLPYAIVPKQVINGERISSSYIRTLLEQGQMEEACCFLAHPHILSGEVQEGKRLGRTLGFPTANIAYPKELVQLPRGVYACKVYAEGKIYTAVTNIGTRPTVGGTGVNVETHLLDFEGDLYGKEITIAFYSFLRPEQKFSSLELLQEEIRKNMMQTRIFFEKK